MLARTRLVQVCSCQHVSVHGINWIWLELSQWHMLDSPWHLRPHLRGLHWQFVLSVVMATAPHRNWRPLRHAGVLWWIGGNPVYLLQQIIVRKIPWLHVMTLSRNLPCLTCSLGFAVLRWGVHANPAGQEKVCQDSWWSEIMFILCCSLPLWYCAMITWSKFSLKRMYYLAIKSDASHENLMFRMRTSLWLYSISVTCDFCFCIVFHLQGFIRGKTPGPASRHGKTTGLSRGKTPSGGIDRGRPYV